MAWEKTAEGKLRHLRDYADEQRQTDRRRAGPDYQRGFQDAMTNVYHHAETLLEQLARGV